MTAPGKNESHYLGANGIGNHDGILRSTQSTDVRTPLGMTEPFVKAAVLFGSRCQRDVRDDSQEHPAGLSSEEGLSTEAHVHETWPDRLLPRPSALTMTSNADSALVLRVHLKLPATTALLTGACAAVSAWPTQALVLQPTVSG